MILSNQLYILCLPGNYVLRQERVLTISADEKRWSMEIKIFVAAHKQSDIPADSLYCPIHVGAALHDRSLPYLTDDTGDNISGKNRSFCELTALYWAWKNAEADVIGLCHYRRYFCEEHSRRILTKETAERLLRKTDIILPKKRNYFIETNYSQYVHAHHEQDLVLTRAILAERTVPGAPDYAAAFDRVMRKTAGHRFNMLLMRRDVLDAYCTWLFDVLFTLEARLDTSRYSDYDARVFGFAAERLLDVWIEANGEKYTELPFLFTEKQNWFKKGGAFLKRKFFPKEDGNHE